MPHASYCIVWCNNEVELYEFSEINMIKIQEIPWSCWSPETLTIIQVATFTISGNSSAKCYSILEMCSSSHIKYTLKSEYLPKHVLCKIHNPYGECCIQWAFCSLLLRCLSPDSNLSASCKGNNVHNLRMPVSQCERWLGPRNSALHLEDSLEFLQMLVGILAWIELRYF